MAKNYHKWVVFPQNNNNNNNNNSNKNLELAKNCPKKK